MRYKFYTDNPLVDIDIIKAILTLGEVKNSNWRLLLRPI